MKRSYLIAAGLFIAAFSFAVLNTNQAAVTDESGAQSTVDAGSADGGTSAEETSTGADDSSEAEATLKTPPPRWNFVTNPAYIMMMLGLNVIVAELLSRHTIFRHFGTTMTVLVTTAVTANLGLLPTNSDYAPIYSGVFTYVAPLSIFWLLLAVNLRDVVKAGVSMVFLFLVGSAGTCLGVVLGMWILGGPAAFGEAYRGVGGTFVGTYIGGAANFTAVAMHYNLHLKPTIFAGMHAVDAFYTLVWMVVTFVVPKTFSHFRRERNQRPGEHEPAPEHISGIDEDTATVHPLDLAFLFTAGAGALWLSDRLTATIDAALQIEIPSIIILTTIALAIAQIPVARKLTRGSQLLGMFGMYVFLSVIGAYCDAAAILRIGQMAVTLAMFTAIVVGTHGLVIFVTASLFRIDLDIAAVASQANIGGATTALGLARSLGRRDLALPGILVGALGYAIGTYLGFFVAIYLL